MSTAYKPLSSSGYTYETVNRRLNRPTEIPKTAPYQEQDYGVKQTGTNTGFTNIYAPTQGQSIQSPITGASIGMSQWGKPLTGGLDESQYGQVLNQNPHVTRLINDEMVRYYGSASQFQLVDIVNKVVNEGMPIDQAINLVRTGKNRNEDEIYAGNLVAGQYDPAINSLDRELDRIARELGININTQEAFGDKYGQRLEDIGGALAGNLKGNRDDIEALYEQARKQTAEAYGQADSRMSEANSMIQSIIGESANQLGLDGSQDRSFSELAQALADSQGINAAGQAGAVGNFANLGADMTGIATQAVSDSQREYAQHQQQLINEVMRNIAGLQFQGATQQNEIGGQIADLEQKRAADLMTTIMDVRNQRLDRERQTSLDQLAAEIQRGTLGLQQQQLGQNASQFDQTMAFNREKFDLEKQVQLTQLSMRKQEFETAMAQTQDPMEQAYLQAQIDNMNAKTQEILTGLAGPNGGGEAPKYKNMEGVQQYLQDNYSGVPYAPTTASQYYSTFNDLWSQAQSAAATNSAPMDAILQGLINQGGFNPQEQNLYNTLALIMSNKYSGF